MTVTRSQLSQPGGAVDPGDTEEFDFGRIAYNMEMGRTGLRRASGYIDDEFLPALRGRKAIAVFREMGDNDPIAGALLFALQRLIAEVTWTVEPASDSAEDRQNAEFLEQCKDDMSHSWSDFVMEALSCLQFGWSWHEMCFKKRLGPWYTNEGNQNLHRSKYDDGKIGLARLPIRAQESLLKWLFYPNGDVRGLIQMPAPTYEQIPIPYAKSLHFRTQAPRGNPEGFSVFRRAYRPWYMKKRIEEYEAMGVERDLAGMPFAKVPARLLAAKEGTKEFAQLQAWKTLVRNIRRDEQDGIIIPSDMWKDGANPEYDFSLLASSGSRQFDTNSIIERYATWMLMQVLADFIMVGHEGTGTYNMHADKSGLFKTAGNSFAQSVADELNRQLVPTLFKVNSMQPAELPRFKPGQVDAPNLTELAAFLTSMAGLGMPVFPDPKMEAFVRQAADLPEMDKAQEQQAAMQQRQQRVLASAQQHLQALQMQQEAATGQMQLQQSAMDTTSQAAELAKPGSTQPPQAAGPGPRKPGGATRPPAKKAQAPAGRSSKTASSKPSRQKAGSK